MPTYDYKCAICKYEFEELQSLSAPPLEECPKCHQNTLQKLIGGGAGILFKGSGFYTTDYKNKEVK